MLFSYHDHFSIQLFISLRLGTQLEEWSFVGLLWVCLMQQAKVLSGDRIDSFFPDPFADFTIFIQDALVGQILVKAE